jgi:hypothetical protein
MKRYFGFALMLAMVAAPAFGGTKPQTVVIPEKVTVGTTQLPAGNYKVSWTGSGPAVQVTLTKDQKTVLTFAAKTVEGKNNPGVTTNTAGGVDTLISIQLRDVSLELEGATTSGQ